MSMQSQTGFKSYKANLTQTSTNDPVVTVLENDFTAIGAITIARTGTGVYTITCANPAFTSGKTRCKIRSVSGVDPAVVFTSTTVITVTTKSDAGAAADGLLTGSALDIEVWN